MMVFFLFLYKSWEKWQSQRAAGWLFVLSLVAYLCSLAIKKTAVALLFPCVALLIISVARRKEEQKFWLGYVVVLVPLSLAYN